MHFLATARKTRKSASLCSVLADFSQILLRFNIIFRKLFSRSSGLVSPTFCSQDDNCHRLDKEKTEC